MVSICFGGGPTNVPSKTAESVKHEPSLEKQAEQFHKDMCDAFVKRQKDKVRLQKQAEQFHQDMCDGFIKRQHAKLKNKPDDDAQTVVGDTGSEKGMSTKKGKTFLIDGEEVVVKLPPKNSAKRAQDAKTKGQISLHQQSNRLSLNA